MRSISKAKALLYALLALAIIIAGILLFTQKVGGLPFSTQ